MRRERLRRLALETIDLSKDPYFFRNHVGHYECRLCLTVHINEANYLAHTQGRLLPHTCADTMPCLLRQAAPDEPGQACCAGRKGTFQPASTSAHGGHSKDGQNRASWLPGDQAVQGRDPATMPALPGMVFIDINFQCCRLCDFASASHTIDRLPGDRRGRMSPAPLYECL